MRQLSSLLKGLSIAKKEPYFFFRLQPKLLDKKVPFCIFLKKFFGALIFLSFVNLQKNPSNLCHLDIQEPS